MPKFTSPAPANGRLCHCCF